MKAAMISDRAPLSGSSKKRVLIADDQPHILEALRLMLKGDGFTIETVSQPPQVVRALESGPFDAVLLDLNYSRDTTSGEEGLELVSQIRSMDALLPVIVMTAWGSVDQAVDAMQRGASDFIQKPWDNRQLLQKLQNQLSCAHLQRRQQSQREDECRSAREIQDNLLPKTLPEIERYDVAAVSKSLRFVGGDYYNVLRLDAHQTVFCIADVCGKGIPAALLMSNLQATLQPLVRDGLTPGELCTRLNRILYSVTPVGKFVSFFYAVLDNEHGRLTYCNAGHNPPLLLTADGGLTGLSEGGAVLGQFRDWPYETKSVPIESGDSLLLFTDGLVEANDTDGEPFGEENIVRVVRENLHANANSLVDLLMRTVSDHCQGDFQDDASLIVLKAR